MKRKSFLSVLLITLIFGFSCKKEKGDSNNQQKNIAFKPSELIVPDNNSEKKRGQVLYLPVYSNIPYQDETRVYNLSAFITIHNTDFFSPVTITKVLFFNNDGILIKNFLDSAKILPPLAASIFFIPEHDKSGTGANFIIEWISDSLVTEPLVESVMVSLSTGQGVSFLSTGKILREVY